MALGIGGDGNGESTALLDAAHEVGSALVAVGVRFVRCTGTARRITAQGHDPGDAQCRVPVDDHVDFCPCLADARDVPGDVEARRPDDIDGRE